MMKAYIANLQAASEEANFRLEEAKAKLQHADPRVLCDKPLTEQIAELMLSLSPTLRDRPWSMEEFVARLKGQYNERPHAMNVGAALRAMGWASKRDWTHDGGGRRYWFIGSITPR